MTQRALNRAPFALVLAAALAASFAGSTAGARAGDDGYGTDAGMAPAAVPVVARIAVVDGQVGIKRGDAGEQTAAAMNAPLMAGDYLTTGADGRVEVQLDANTIVRVGADSQLRFTKLDGQSDVAQLAQGTMELRVLASDQDQVQVQTPSINVEPSQPGAYLITVTHDGNTELTARSGSLAVVTPQGTQDVDPGRTMLIAGTASNPQYQYEDEVALTGLEQWGDQRDQQMLAAQNTDAQYLGSDVAGAGDLNADGQWVDIPGYGNAWVPSDVRSNWTPYSDGTWTN
ncbi:MAG TPA: FecR domain-containing protein, partial [Candidatus Aquilonibacter sp.]